MYSKLNSPQREVICLGCQPMCLNVQQSQSCRQEQVLVTSMELCALWLGKHWCCPPRVVGAGTYTRVSEI